MILIILGTQDKKFTRLLKEVDKLITKNIIKEEVIVQAGYTSDYKSNNMQIFDLLQKDKFDELVEKANLLITHGGVGTILTGLKNNKKIIAVPRLKKYKEHVNDHQIQIIENFDKEGYITGINDVSDLENALLRVDDFTPLKYKSNKKNMVNLIKELIDK